MPSDAPKILVVQNQSRGRRLPLFVLLVLFLCAVSALIYYFYGSIILSVEVVSKSAIQKEVQLLQDATLPAQADPALPAAPAIVNDKHLILDALRPNLLLHLPFANSLQDHSANRHAVGMEGVVEITEDGAHFSGAEYLTFPFIALNDRPFSFALWIKPEGQVVGYGLLEQVDGGSGKHLHLLLRDPDKPRMGFYLNDLQSTQSVTAEMGWSHLVYQYTGSHQQIWLNGKLLGENATEAYHGEKGATHIGKAPRWNNVPTTYFKGWMRDVRLYGVSLTPAQIRALADRGGNTQNPLPPKPKDDEIF